MIDKQLFTYKEINEEIVKTRVLIDKINELEKQLNDIVEFQKIMHNDLMALQLNVSRINVPPVISQYVTTSDGEPK